MDLENVPSQRKLSFPSCIPGDSNEKLQERASEAFQIALDLVRSDRMDSQLRKL
jgi:hypothetical protein